MDNQWINKEDPGQNLAVFCDSEFWHGKDWDTQKNRIGTNKEYWEKKIYRNIERDQIVNNELVKAGWSVVRFWEKDLEETIWRLLNSDKIVTQQILLLTNKGYETVLEGWETINDLPLKKLDDHAIFEPSTIYYSTPGKIKGLEVDFVFALDEDDSSDPHELADMRLYVMATRAKHRLYRYKCK